MPRHIDADALQRDLHGFFHDLIIYHHDVRFKSLLSDVEKGALCRINDQPTISPDDVRGVGEWIEDRMDYRCSACGETVKDEIFYMFYPYRLPKFCPNCGARMKGAEDGTAD